MSHTLMAALLGLWELLLVAAVLLVPVIIAGVVLVIYFINRRKRQPAPVPPAMPASTVKLGRTCPNCGTSLRPDLPEGLCPTCLLQHGIATEAGPAAGPTPFTPPTLEELGKLFPQLEIIGTIGKGGMGAVYKARQPALDRFVALKILAPKPDNELDFSSRFSREAKALARLSHPNIVAVYDFGQVSGLSYFIMEYVDGPNLRQVQQAGRLSPKEALGIIPQICAALQFAHDEGIVHRDIKPENVLLDRKGRVKIADFGLAKILGQEPKDFRLTGARDVMGTPHYMAPEQVEKPQEVDHRADIYSLGVVFYEMLTGELPLGKFPPPSQKVEVDVRLDEVVLRALEKEPARRYQQASDVKTQVETIAGAPSGPTSPPAGANIPASPAAGKTSRLSLICVSLFLLGIFGTLFLMALSPRHDMALIFGGTALVAAIGCGIASWSEKASRVVVLITGSIVALLLTGAAVVAFVVGPMRAREARAARNAAIQQQEAAKARLKEYELKQKELAERAVQLASNSVPPTPHSPSETPPEASPVVIALDDGRAEFLGIGTASGTERTFWSPNGVVTTNDPVSQANALPLPPRPPRYGPGFLPGGPTIAAESRNLQFVLGVKGSFNGTMTVDGRHITLFPRPQFRYPRTSLAPDCFWIGDVEVPSTQAETDFEMDVRAGPWLVNERVPGSESGSIVGLKITCGGLKWNVSLRLQETNGCVRLTGRYPVFSSEGWDQQLVLLSGSGSAYNYFTNESALSHGAITFYDVDETYRNLTLDEVADVRFRIRPVQRYEIRHVSLKAGHFTTVTVTNITRWNRLPNDFKVEVIPAQTQNEQESPVPVVAQPAPVVETTNVALDPVGWRNARERKARDLTARYDAARSILSFVERDSAMAAVARDAATIGEAEITSKAVSQITAFTTRDETIKVCALRLAHVGLRTEAARLAKNITSFVVRDEVLRELAKKD